MIPRSRVMFLISLQHNHYDGVDGWLTIRHLNSIKRNIFKKLVNGGKTCNVFRGTTSKKLNHYIPPTLHEDQPDFVLIHIGSNDINNQAEDKINTEMITRGILSTLVNLASILV